MSNNTNKITWNAETDNRLFLTILAVQSIAVDYSKVAAVFKTTPTAISQRMFKLRQQARKLDGLEGLPVTEADAGAGAGAGPGSGKKRGRPVKSVPTTPKKQIKTETNPVYSGGDDGCQYIVEPAQLRARGNVLDMPAMGSSTPAWERPISPVTPITPTGFYGASIQASDPVGPDYREWAKNNDPTLDFLPRHSQPLAPMNPYVSMSPQFDPSSSGYLSSSPLSSAFMADSPLSPVADSPSSPVTDSPLSPSPARKGVRGVNTPKTSPRAKKLPVRGGRVEKARPAPTNATKKGGSRSRAAPLRTIDDTTAHGPGLGGPTLAFAEPHH